MSSDRCTRTRALRAIPWRALNRALAPPKLHRQHFARSSYRCGIRLTGSCNSIFKDEHPSFAPIAPTSRPERAPHFHDARLTSATGTGLGYRRFLPIQTAAPAASDAPRPLPRRRVNDTGLKCELGTPSSRNTVASPALADTTRWLARPTAPSAATDGVLARARQHSPTSAIDAKPEHTGKRSLTRRSAAFHGVALRLAALRRCEAAPTVQSGVSAVLGTEAGSGC